MICCSVTACRTVRRGGSGEHDSWICCSTERERRFALIAILFLLSLTEMGFKMRRSWGDRILEGEVVFKRSNPSLALDFHLEFNVRYA